MITAMRYRQHYKGLLVEGAVGMVHYRDNEISSVNVTVAEGLNLNTTPGYTEMQARTAACNSYPEGTVFAWQDSSMEAELKMDREDSTATYFPNGQLLITHVGIAGDMSVVNFQLAWRFFITTTEGLTHQVYVNAQTGTVLKMRSTKQEDGPANVIYYGSQTLDTKWRGFPYFNHYLRAEGNGKSITTKFQVSGGGCPLPWGWTCRPNVTDDDDDWGYYDQAATTAHWVVTQAWDFFRNTYNRNGPNAYGGDIRIYADHPTVSADATYEEDNDFSTPFIMRFGNRNGNHRCNLDIAGHEFTHGLLLEMDGPRDDGEPASLNESFCDIFGFMVERYSQPNSWDWLVGEDSELTRNIQNPSASPAQGLGSDCPGQTWPTQPETYHDANWYYGSCDDEGQHVNNGVQNRWFYLLSQGGTQNGVAVQGIGPDKAAVIAYYNMENNLASNSNYSASRNGAITAATNLFGFCSNEAIQTQNAWAAVNVGIPAYPTVTGPTTVYVSGTNNVVFPSMPVTYTANINAAGSNLPYLWTVPNGWSYTVGGPLNSVLTVTNFNGQFPLFGGTTNVTVRRSGCISTTFGINFVQLGGGGGGYGEPLPGGGGGRRFRLWPNPNRGNDLYFDAEFENEGESLSWMVKIFDTRGVQHFNQSYSGDLPRSVDVSGLSSGTYLLYIQRGDVMQAAEFVRQQ